MKTFIFWFFSLIVSSVAYCADAPAQAIPLPKPHDKTGHALDIMVHKDVIREDYGARLYMKYCSSCHGRDRTGKDPAPELSAQRLGAFDTISELYLHIQKGCPNSGTDKPARLGSVKLIFISRYIKKPLKKK